MGSTKTKQRIKNLELYSFLTGPIDDVIKNFQNLKAELILQYGDRLKEANVIYDEYEGHAHVHIFYEED